MFHTNVKRQIVNQDHQRAVIVVAMSWGKIKAVPGVSAPPGQPEVTSPAEQWLTAREMPSEQLFQCASIVERAL